MMVKHKLSYRGISFYKNNTEARMLAKLHNAEPLSSINKLLRDFLQYEIKVSIDNIHNWNFLFRVERNKKEIPFFALSSGKKGYSI